MIESLRTRTTALALLFGSLLMASASMASSQPALATTAPDQLSVDLSLKPVEQDGPYFDLMMEPGETRTLAVELGNQGADSIDVFTYAADAYTVTNGGFGAKERGSAPAGTTTWLSYPSEVLQLPAGEGLTREFSVAVPAGTEPGQYLTSVVLENNVAIEGSGGVALDQIVRHAVAVSINIPGPSTPALELGEAGHTLTAGRSSVDVAVSNTGNMNLWPQGELTIRDAEGATISQAPITMNTFYARTGSHVSTTLNGTLEPGEYTLTATLTDAATGTTASGTDLPFTVTEPSKTESTTEVQANQLPQIFQETPSEPTPYLIAASLVLILTILAIMIRRHRHATTSD
jgi:hypothetical protein